MSIPGKVLIALLTSLVVAAVAAYLESSYSFVGLLLPTAVAAVSSVVLSHRALPVPEAIATDASASGMAANRPQEKSGVGKDPGGRRGQRRDAGRDSKREEQRSRKRHEKSEDKPTAKRDPGDGGRGDTRGSAAGTGSATSNAAPGGEAEARGEAEEGTVKWFNVTKGYGFIIRESGEEIFVHHRSVLGDGRGRLDDGARVRFRVAQTDKGPQAEAVEPL